jgi:hypothetical protein
MLSEISKMIELKAMTNLNVQRLPRNTQAILAADDWEDKRNNLRVTSQGYL